jgi:hypothetical protein
LRLYEPNDLVLLLPAQTRYEIAPIARGNAQMHWPEGNALIKRGVRDPESGIPDYNATVEIERVD